MKTEQKQKAEELFFQTDLTKTEIADAVGISRRALHYWVNENNWDRLKRSASTMPTMLVENCYYAMMHLTTSILSEDRILRPITRQEADTLHKLTLTINKLKGRTSLNESMELFTHLMNDVHAKKPELAKELKPFIDNYITARAATQPWQFTPEKFNDNGLFPLPDQNKPDLETQLDLQDHMFWSENLEPHIENPKDIRSTTENLQDFRHCEERSNLDTTPIHTPAGHSEARSELNTTPANTPSYATSPSPLGEGRGEAPFEGVFTDLNTKETTDARHRAIMSSAEELIKAHTRTISKTLTPHLNRQQRRALARTQSKTQTLAAA